MIECNTKVSWSRTLLRWIYHSGKVWEPSRLLYSCEFICLHRVHVCDLQESCLFIRSKSLANVNKCPRFFVECDQNFCQFLNMSSISVQFPSLLWGILKLARVFCWAEDYFVGHIAQSFSDFQNDPHLK